MQTEPRAHGLRPIMAVALRLVWLPLVAGGIVALGANAIPMYEQAHVVCRTGCLFTPVDVVALRASGISLDAASAWGVGLLFGTALVWLASAGFVYWKASKTAIGLSTAYFLALVPIHFVLSARFGNTPMWRLESLLEIALTAASALFLYTFPDGRFRPRWLLWLWVAASVYYIPRTLLHFHALDSVFFPALFLGGAAVQVYRYRRVSGAEQQRQSRWVISGIVVAVLAGAAVSLPVSAGFQVHGVVQLALATVVLALLTLIPMSIAAAILRSQLWGVDVVLNRALVYTLLGALLAGLYLAVVALAGVVFQRRLDPLFAALAAGAVALLVHPLHLQLQRGINRVFYGNRDDPYAVLSELSRQIGRSVSQQTMLEAIVETVAATLRLPYVAIELGGSIAASHGRRPDATGFWPLEHQQATLGRLVASARKGETFSEVDCKLLSDLALQLGVAAHAVKVQADLQRAREDLVIAREEERRRLRRDLHDGLGATLSALTLKAGLARSILDTEQAAADRLLIELEHELKGGVGEIRRLVEGLRPAALDQRGLLAAIEDLAASHASPNGGLKVSVESEGALDDLPAATELAAYRIVQEALNNAGRHSRAHSCRVRITNNHALRLEVSDDGVGLAVPSRTGVGLSSMRERAEEVGGSFVLESEVGHGLRISALLPTQLNQR